MFEFTLGARRYPLHGLRFQDRLDGLPDAIIRLADGCTPPERGAEARLIIGDRPYRFQVDEFDLPPPDQANGAIRLVDPAAQAPPYLAAIFSGVQGTTWREVLESRTPLQAPPELAHKLAAVVADVPLTILLDHVCALHPGWAWWAGPDGLEMGLPPDRTLRAEGVLLSEQVAGAQLRLADLPPRVGSLLELPQGRRGVVVTVQIQWRAGELPHCTVLLGPIPTPRFRRPTGEVTWPAVLRQLNPLLVDIQDEEDPSRTFSSQARYMGRAGDSSRFLEEIPVQPGDALEARIPLGGVSVLAPRVYLWQQTLPAGRYQVRSDTLDLALAKSLTLTTQQVEEAFERRISRVRQRWDINKA